MKRLILLLTFLCAFFFTVVPHAFADCGCKTDCAGRLDLRRVQGTPWMGFMSDIKKGCGATPISAYRSTHCQQQLYSCIKRRGCGTLVGRPGRSPHETGIALDYSNRRKGIRACMEKAKKANVPRANFGKPHPGQHIDNGGRKSSGAATASRPHSQKVKQFKEKRRSPAHQRKVQNHRKKNGFTNQRRWFSRLFWGS